MPRKNSVKQYIEDGYYHIYNRGVEKRQIFLDDRDYKTFLYILKSYLDPNEKINPKTSLVNMMNLSWEVDLMAYCLMPNHYHLLVHQKLKDGIKKIIQRVATNYVMYFNRRYKRIGPLFQGVYKAVLIDTDEYLLHLSSYIHRNPIPVLALRVRPSRGSNPLASYSYSSYGDYLGFRKSAWIKPQIILDYFTSPQASEYLQKKPETYKHFVEGEDDYSDEILDKLYIDQID